MTEFINKTEAERLVKWGRTALVLLVVFLAVQTLVGFKEWSAPSVAYNTIVVTGYAEVNATPDVASFSFAVSQDAATVAEAQAVVTEKTDTILLALYDLGIEEKDIRTSSYNVYPRYTYTTPICSPTYCPPQRQIPDGFTVSHNVEVKVRNIDDAGEALALAGEIGATNISSLSFLIDDPDALEAEARNEAIEEARTKAKVLAKSLKVRLGRVIDFSDSSYNPTPYSLRFANEAYGSADVKVSAPTLPTGENKITSNVTITYEIR